MPLVRNAPDDLGYCHELARWITDSQNMAQRLGTPERFRLRQCDGMATLRRWHDRLALDLNARMASGEAAGEPVEIAYGPPPLPGNAFIIPITSYRELQQEGQSQGHCVVTYHERIQSGRYFVYRVLEPERCTLGLALQRGQPPRIDQLQQGRRAQPPGPETWRLAHNWLTRECPAFSPAENTWRQVAPEPPPAEPIAINVPSASQLAGSQPAAIQCCEFRFAPEGAVGKDYCGPAILGLVAIGAAANQMVLDWQTRRLIDWVDFIYIDPLALDLNKHTPCATSRHESRAPREPLSCERPQYQPARNLERTFGDWLEEADMVLMIGDFASEPALRQARQIAALYSRRWDLKVALTLPLPPYASQAQRRAARENSLALLPLVDSVIALSHRQAVPPPGNRWTPDAARAAAQTAWLHTVRSMTDTIARPVLIGVDYSDVRRVLCGTGRGAAGIGTGSGPRRAEQATRQALASLTARHDLYWAHRLLIHLTTGLDLRISEIDEAATLVREQVTENVYLLISDFIDPDFPVGQLQVTILAAGLDA